MPPPRVVCCVCGQEVNKAQTLHIGDGRRACRHHENTVAASKRECEKIEHEKQEALRKTKEKKQRETPTLEPQCVICGRTGIRQEDWYTRLMIEVKKYEITHGKPINPLTEMSKVASGALAGTNCLYYVMWRGENTKVRVPFTVYEFIKMQESMGMEPILLVCQDCALEKKFVTVSQERFDNLVKDDMFFLTASFLHAAIGPQIEKMAVKEIIESN